MKEIKLLNCMTGEYCKVSSINEALSWIRDQGSPEEYCTIALQDETLEEDCFYYFDRDADKNFIKHILFKGFYVSAVETRGKRLPLP